MRDKKGALEFSFAWIFAIIAGIFILMLTIYGVIKFINLEKASLDAQTAKDIGVLTNPLESSFESIKRTMISTPSETRIYTSCSNSTFFGRQAIKVSQKSYNEWSEGSEVNFQNKYIFSENPVEGKNYYLFSRPFKFPFKVGDLIYLTSTRDKYCFRDAPKEIEEEIEALRGNEENRNENLFIYDGDEEDCPEGSINICFRGGSDCDTRVYTSSKYVVKKDGKRMYYEGDALMYAAIFSNKEDYECQIDRLMRRTEQLANIYEDKSKFVFKETGCDSGLSVDLVQLANYAKTVENSNELALIYSFIKDVDIKNEYSECNLW